MQLSIWRGLSHVALDHAAQHILQVAIAVCTILLISGSIAVGAEPQRERANLLVILVDDLGYGDLSCYGASDLKTPHVDRLAQGGTSLTNFYANCPVCSPTRAALLSGRYPDRVGVPGVIRTHAENNWGFLDPAVELLPAVLAGAGYKTGMIGKWHLGLESPSLPTERGFQTFRGYLGDMMDDYYTHRRHGINYMRAGSEEIDPAGHATDLFSDWACEFLSQQTQETPFFLYLAYNAPHTPIQPPEEHLRRVTRRAPEMDLKRAELVALIEHLDEGIGRVLDCLDRSGLAGDTLVVFSSDNGGQLNVGANNGPLRNGKGSMYEGGLKVPTIFVWPARIAGDQRSPLTGITMDLFPTLLDAADVQHDGPIDGISLLPQLLGATDQDPPRELYFTRREGGFAYGGQTIDAIRRGPWKLLQNSPYEPLELYNLDDDPRETTNLVADRPKRVRELDAAMRLYRQRGGAVPWQPPAE